MSSPQELVLMRYQLFPGLDEAPIEVQRDKIAQLFVGRGLIADESGGYTTENPVNDIDKLRHDGLTDYVERVEHRMRHGDILEITAPGGVLTAQNLFTRIFNQDKQARPALFKRHISRSRLHLAKQTGSDRDNNSELDYHDGFNEAQAVKEYAITDPSDITYVSAITPDDLDLHFEDDMATLVYAIEGLQPLSPYKNNRHGSIGLAAFVDKRLKQRSLLAVIQKSA